MKLTMLTLAEVEELEAHGAHLLYDNPDTWKLLISTAKFGAIRASQETKGKALPYEVKKK